MSSQTKAIKYCLESYKLELLLRNREHTYYGKYVKGELKYVCIPNNINDLSPLIVQKLISNVNAIFDNNGGDVRA